MLDPRFKEVSFSASALDMQSKECDAYWIRIVNAYEAHNGTDNAAYVISDDQNAAADSAEKKGLWDSFKEELKKKASHQLTTQHNKEKHELRALYLIHLQEG